MPGKQLSLPVGLDVPERYWINGLTIGGTICSLDKFGWSLVESVEWNGRKTTAIKFAGLL